MASTLLPLERPLLAVVLTSWPDGQTPLQVGESSAFCINSGNAVRIFGRCSANGGKLYLIEHQPSSSNEWWPVDNDNSDQWAIQIGTSVLGGRFGKTFFTGDRRVGTGSGNFALYYETGGGGAAADLTAWVAPRLL